MDDEFDDWDRDEIVDLDGCYGDVTGDRQLDVLGYESPRRNLGPPPPAPDFDWLAQDRWNQAQAKQADIERRDPQGAVAGAAVPPAGGLWRAAMRWWWRWVDAIGAPLLDGDRSEGRPSTYPVWPEGPSTTVPVWPEGPSTTVPQHGAYFEVRTRRVWWAPWRKRPTWTQVSTWRVGGPPNGVDVVTVPDVSALPGQVHTIGTVSQTGAVEW